jgi:integrase
MATTRKRGKTHSARWIKVDNTYGEKGGFKTKAQAKLYANQEEIRVKSGQVIAPMYEKLTVGDYIVNYWKNTLTCSAQTKIDYQNTLNKHVIPEFGHMKMSDVKLNDLKKWYATLLNQSTHLGERRSEYTVQKYAYLFSSILKSAVDADMLEKSPFSKWKRPKAKPARKATPLEVSRAKLLAQTLAPKWRLLVWLPFFTGLRPSEALGLTIDRIDFKKREIEVNRQLSRDKSMVFTEKLKTEASYRTIPMATELERIIKEHIATYGLGPDGLLFQNRLGQILRYKDASVTFRKAARKIGMKEREGMHVLRHTFASTLIRSGANVKAIQTLMGHSNIKETFDTYGHLFPNDLHVAVGNLDTLFAEDGKTSTLLVV